MDEDTDDDGAVSSEASRTNGDGGPAPDVVDGDPPAPDPDHGSGPGTDLAATSDPDSARLRAYLRPEESLRTVARGTLLNDPRGPAVVGLTDDRFVAVTDAGSFLAAGFDRVRSVRGHTATLPTVRGVDARLCFAVGFLAAVVGFLGVLATETNPFTPALAFLAAGGAMVVTHVRYEGVSVEPPSGVPDFVTSLSREVRHHFVGSQVANRFVGGPVDLDARRDWIRERVGEMRPALWVGSGAVVLSLALVAFVESGFAAPLFVVATATGVALVVFGFHHGRTFDRLALGWRHERTVTAALDDGTTVTIRTEADSDLDSRIATRVGGPNGANRAERSSRRSGQPRRSRRSGVDSNPSTPSRDLDQS